MKDDGNEYAWDSGQLSREVSRVCTQLADQMAQILALDVEFYTLSPLTRLTRQHRLLRDATGTCYLPRLVGSHHLVRRGRVWHYKSNQLIRLPHPSRTSDGSSAAHLLDGLLQLLPHCKVVVKGANDMDALLNHCLLHGLPLAGGVQVVDIGAINAVMRSRFGDRARLADTYRHVARELGSPFLERLLKAYAPARPHDVLSDAFMALVVALFWFRQFAEVRDDEAARGVAVRRG
jgi:hypothetical protein